MSKAGTSATANHGEELHDGDLDLLFQPPTPPSYQQTLSDPSNTRLPTYRGRLPKPIALPQIALPSDSPFLRAYAPELEAFDVSQAKWLEFIDGLTYVMIASPALQALDMHGRFVVISPVSWIRLAGAAARQPMQMRTHSKTNKFLERANSSYFAPRGLRVRFMKTKALRAYIELLSNPSNDGSKGKGKESFMSKLGKGAEKTVVSVRVPIISGIADSILKVAKPLPPPASSSSSSAFSGAPVLFELASRRLAMLGESIAALNVDVPDASPPTTGLSARASALAVRMHADNSKKREEERKKSAEEAEKDRHDDVERRRELVAAEDALWLVVLTTEQDRLLVGEQAASSSSGDAGLHVVCGQTTPPEKS